MCLASKQKKRYFMKENLLNLGETYIATVMVHMVTKGFVTDVIADKES